LAFAGSTVLGSIPAQCKLLSDPLHIARPRRGSCVAARPQPAYNPSVAGVDELRARLQNYFLSRPEVAMAFLFGSAARARLTADSDLDVAVYFYSAGAGAEWEEQHEYPEEDSIWADVERIASIDTDLLVLNRAPATVAYAVLEENCPIVVKDVSLYWGLFLAVSSAAEDFRQFTREFLEIKERSRSLSEIDRDRLRRILDFIATEIADAGEFATLSRESYLTESSSRRNVERWIENIVNASIDVAKILLAAAQASVPQTYREILLNLDTLPNFETRIAEALSRFSRLRNILAHEYLDLRWGQISTFLREAVPFYQELFQYASRALRVDNPSK
jgi:uncharacterized protein YutE (UPF0331/DUF86 family)/predicted nucleotidyltransferase